MQVLFKRASSTNLPSVQIRWFDLKETQTQHTQQCLYSSKNQSDVTLSPHDRSTAYISERTETERNHTVWLRNFPKIINTAGKLFLGQQAVETTRYLTATLKVKRDAANLTSTLTDDWSQLPCGLIAIKLLVTPLTLQMNAFQVQFNRMTAVWKQFSNSTAFHVFRTCFNNLGGFACIYF